MKLIAAILFSLIAPCTFVSISFTQEVIKVPITKTDTTRLPTVSVEKTTIDSMKIVTIRDTAWSYDSFILKLNRNYGQLFSFIMQSGLRPNRIMGFYYSLTTPTVFETAVEVDKFPKQTFGKIKINKINREDAIVAHYQGPYRQIGIAYSAIENYFKNQNKTANQKFIEVYLNNPSTVKDSFDLRTDVYRLLNK